MRSETDKIPVKNIDEYLFDIPENQRLALEEIRQIIRETAPDAEEVISYGIQFTPEKPLPVALVQKIVLLRMKENEEKAAAKKVK